MNPRTRTRTRQYARARSSVLKRIRNLNLLADDKMGSMPKTMKALVFHGPYDVRLEDRPVPTIKEPTDLIVKTTSAALCGSEMHAYRGHAKPKPGYITGHEGAGIVQEVGPAVKNFKVGDFVVPPFNASCGECLFCKTGCSGRCSKLLLFGTHELGGSQAEYFRVPMADSTLYMAPKELGEEVILMSDIFPTGWNGARNAFREFPKESWSELTVVVIGCGPVAQCAIVSALEYRPARLYAVDSVPERLERARTLGATPLNFKTTDVKEEIMRVTDGRGADGVIEVVGHSDALRMAFDIVRVAGRISVIGLHTENLPFHGNEAYNKNLNIQFGRCPVGSVFPDALEVLIRNKEKFKGFVDVIIPQIDESYAPALADFEKNKVNKVVFKPHGMNPTL